MQYKLDYLSFSFPILLQAEKDNVYTLNSILLAFHDHTAHRLLGIITNGLWQWEQPVGFYKSRIKCPKTHVQIQWSPGNRFALCVCSGQALDVLFMSLDSVSLAQMCGSRATRLDFAVDFATNVTPKEFVDAGKSESFRGNSFIESETGTTCYIGSRASERMARIYRFAAPHPRSHLLRVEAEYKGDAAKQICAAMTNVPLTEICLSAHAPFAWQSPLWNPDGATISKIPARAYDKEGAGTILWLLNTVAPALKKAAKDKLIDLDEWIDENLRK